jgi:peptidoglycan/LPS O-acetylase OafA/YrhL
MTDLRMTAPPRYLTLDHWRGLACLAVLVNHAVWHHTGTQVDQALYVLASRLWIGVPVFFVISGYCISAAVDSHRRQTSRPLHVYFTRRLRRIYPPYWAVLAATLLAVAVIDISVPRSPLSASGEFLRPWWYGVPQWLGNVSLTEIWRPHVIAGQKALMLGHAWTLCYEEQFYVVAGLLLWMIPRAFFAGTVAVTVATALAVSLLPSASIDGFFFDGSWFQFWLGVLVYHVIAHRGRARVPTLIFLLAVSAMVAVDWRRLLEPGKNGPQAILIASLFAAAILVLHRHDEKLARVRILRPVQTCGVMCYSLYLVHLPVIKFLRVAANAVSWQPQPLVSLAISTPLCLAVAYSFHRAVERRFLNARTPTEVPAVATVDVQIPERTTA